MGYESPNIKDRLNLTEIKPETEVYIQKTIKNRLNIT